MKFNKIMIGLMAIAPFTLASCNNAMSYKDIQDWVSKHYIKTAEEPRAVITTFHWDYHATKSDGRGMEVVDKIFKTLAIKAKTQLGIDNVIYFPGADKVEGETKDVSIHNVITPLNKTELDNLNEGTNHQGHYGKRNEKEGKEWDGTYKETFKIYDNALTVSSNEDMDTGTGNDKFEVSCLYAYNAEGYLTGYGFKIGRYYINTNNIIKLKVTLEFEYSH